MTRTIIFIRLLIPEANCNNLKNDLGILYKTLYNTKEIFKAKSWRRRTVKERSVCLCLVFAPIRRYFEYGMFIGRRKETSVKEELEYTATNMRICEHILTEN